MGVASLGMRFSQEIFMDRRTNFLAKRKSTVLAVFAGTLLMFAADAIAETYTYDALGRLASVTNDSGVKTYYCYDKAGNRTYVGPTACP
jgi:YD repeat-containing protein